MGAIETFRDALFGNPRSANTQPSREGSLAAFTELVTAITQIATAVTTNAATVIKPTLSALNGDLAHGAGTLGIVYGTGAGIYVKVGSSGSGSWTATGLMLEGPQGPDGRSFYEIAIDTGYVPPGTSEVDFVNAVALAISAESAEALALVIADLAGPDTIGQVAAIADDIVVAADNIAAILDAPAQAAAAEISNQQAAAMATSVNAPLLTARANALIGSSDTYDFIGGLSSTLFFAATANRAYMASALDCPADVAVGVVMDAVCLPIDIDATCTNLRVYIYSGLTASGTINTAPPSASWTLLKTINIAPAAAGVTPGGGKMLATVPIDVPIVTETGKSYAVAWDARDVTNARLRLGYGYYDATGDGRQRFYGWYHGTAATADGTWTNASQAQKVALRFATKRISDVLNLDGRLSTVSTRSLTSEQHAEVDLAMEVHRLNESALDASGAKFPITLADAATFWGDSLTFQSSSLVTAGETSYDIVTDFFPGSTLNNQGVSGETAAQIDTRIAAASAGQLNDYSFLWSSTNDLLEAKHTGATTSDITADVMTTIATSVARFTTSNYMVATAHGNATTGHVGSRAFGTIQKLRKLARTTYGAKSWHSHYINAYAGTRSKADNGGTGANTGLSTGRPPPSILADTFHLGTIGCYHIGRLWTRFLRAMAGGVPYVHPDLFGIKNGQAVDSAIGTVRILGTPLSSGMWRGDGLDRVRYDPTTKALTRGAATVSADVEDVYIEGRHRKGSHIGRITLVRQMDGTNPALGGVRVDGTYGSVGLGTPGLVGAVAGKKLTIVITARFLSNATGNFIGSDIAGVATFLAGQTITCQVRTAANALIAGPSTPVAADPLDWNTYFFSFDTTTGIVRSLAAVNDKAASSTSPTADALINIPGVTSLLVNGVGSGPLIGVDIRRIWIAADTWDFTSLTERQKFTVGTAYGTPKDLGGTGAVDGVTPLVDIYGRVGDFIVGRNGGSGGDLYFPNWIDSAHCGLSTPPDAAA